MDIPLYSSRRIFSAGRTALPDCRGLPGAAMCVRGQGLHAHSYNMNISYSFGKYINLPRVAGGFLNSGDCLARTSASLSRVSPQRGEGEPSRSDSDVIQSQAKIIYFMDFGLRPESCRTGRSGCVCNLSQGASLRAVAINGLIYT